ncbi:peroxide stress protein YaaA [Alteromonas sediminis]|uniref:UPF0246 protein DRW07_00395 n=1 Tax=Alteromonas sediminis TaxID=2259342 RepID=A0A3N5Y262_9ALTE|nr:peroxide stress protein YaaA [Alteromonas sediminis]RPJ67907.1 peroxide stress protein YaaA [Alteromonas sediminis]
MLIVVSPAKNLDVTSAVSVEDYTLPDLIDDTMTLVDRCKTLSPSQLGSLMSISDKLAVLNAERFNSFTLPLTKENAKQAMYMFNGDVYTGLDAQSLDDDDVAFAQKHLRILSGLYGILRPLDLIQPYRLEMGTKLDNSRGKNLYEFWNTKLAEKINTELNEASEQTLVNLASNEYFKAVDKKALNATIITPVFKDYKNGQYKIISFYAKKARGLMARYIIQNKLTSSTELSSFNLAGYVYSEKDSTPDTPVFLRDSQE